MIEADKISIALVVVTAIMVVATAFMAYFTYLLAKSTVAGNLQADRHHQQNLRPFCVVEFESVSYPKSMFGANSDPAARRAKADMGILGTSLLGNEIYIQGELKNKGNGLAKDIVVYLNTRRGVGESEAFRITRPVVVTGLVGAGETIAIDIMITDRNIMKVWNGMTWTDVFSIDFIPNETYEVVLEYKDIFENYFRTVHPKGIYHDTLSDTAMINQKEKQIEIVLRPNLPMPIFLSGQQSVLTMADFPYLPQMPEPLNEDKENLP